MFDVESFLDEYKIDHKTGGKNVTSGWIEINCPFCLDPSYHMGINKKSGLHHCWICGAKGGAEGLIKRLLKVSFNQAKSIVREYTIRDEEDEKPREEIEQVVFPKGIEKGLAAIHREYLEKRLFDVPTLIDKYDLRHGLYTGDFAYRIVIPITINGQIVAFTGRDVTGEQDHKYKHSKNDQSIMQVKDCLYNIDTVKDKVLILEGVTDVWRLGDGSVGLFGKVFTYRQLNLLYERNIKEAYVMLDAERTEREANKLASALTTFIDHVEIIQLDGEEALDPAELSDDEVKKLREEINL